MSARTANDGGGHQIHICSIESLSLKFQRVGWVQRIVLKVGGKLQYRASCEVEPCSSGLRTLLQLYFSP